ncbi:dihydrolipoamide acetyltransferase family protein, partial [Chelativorans sp.]|uniref:dihydrolipoamide acetyltransferase family protein n=1 Tax=Chelativorans sp. TaxID=2203393 RepID=UPI00281220B3
MPVEVILPKVDMDMSTGRISRWAVQEGATVKKGDLLFEIETDKAAMEIDAPAAGIVRNIIGKEGVDIPVGQAVAWIYEEGEAAVEASPLPAPNAPERDPAAAKPDAIVPAPPREEIRPDAEQSMTPPQKGGAMPNGQGKVRATPLARRLARENGIELSGLSGSGPHGRVVRADVEAAAVGSSTPSGRAEGARAGGGVHSSSPETPIPALRTDPPRPGPTEGGEDRDAILKLYAEGTYDLVPHDSMRRTIARRLVEAKSTIPHFYLTLDCEIDALLTLRKQLNDAAPMVKTEAGEKPAYKLSVNDMIIKAFAMALKAVPDANVSWTESAMVRHRHADVGVAVSIPGGLITPIVRRADEKTLSAISNEMKDLASRARNRKLKPEEYQGGSAAISNLGMFGIKDFAAVINPPHATILAVGAGEERPVVKGGEIKVATIMSVTLS